MLLSVVGACLSVTLLSSSALAETCTASPDCKSLGYTESSCSDGGVKCPFGNFWFCGGKKDVCQSCHVGWILNSDLTCSAEKVSGKTPIGVIANQMVTSAGAALKCISMAVALNDIGFMVWSSANFQSQHYSAGGVTGWRLPTKEELVTIYDNLSSVRGGLTKTGGADFVSNWYWSSSNYYSADDYWVVTPVSGVITWDRGSRSYFARPVLTF